MLVHFCISNIKDNFVFYIDIYQFYLIIRTFFSDTYRIVILLINTRILWLIFWFLEDKLFNYLILVIDVNK
jgi:hypothetical protein